MKVTTVKDLNSALKIVKVRLEKQYSKSIEIQAGILQGAVNEKGQNVAYYASCNEYGTEKIPPRPFMRKAYKTRKPEWQAQISRNLERGHTVEITALATARTMQDDIRKSIDGEFGEWQPNKNPKIKDTVFTIKNKKQSKMEKHHKKPLIDSSMMYNNVGFKIMTGIGKGED